MMALKPIESTQHYFLRKPLVADKLLTIIDEVEKSIVFRHISQRKLMESQASQASQASNITSSSKKQESPIAKHTSSGHAAELLLEKNKGDFSRTSMKMNFHRTHASSNDKFNLDDYFLGAIFQAYQLARESHSVVKLSGLWRPICFFPDTSEVYVDLTKSQLRSVCATSIASQSITLVPRDIKIEKTRREWELKSCHKAERFYSIESFIWRVALYTSRGRIPDFMDVK
ncbi:MAG: hypothetical protein Q9N32_02540 [Gammaproteobacteria bacterium]|nr:hypothetical protein [Gammaproteobacteria bacterium]